MSTFLFKGDEKQGGIPKKARVRIEALPDKTPVFSGTVSDALYVELDPGKYAASVVKLTGSNGMRDIDNCCYTMEFLHEVSEESWQELKTIRPKLARVINTSEGPRYRCRIPGCDHEGTTPVSALMHEVTDHLGVKREDFLANPRGARVKAAIQKGAELATSIQNEEGRPKKVQLFGVEDEVQNPQLS